MNRDAVRSWGREHPMLFALLVWLIPVLILAPVLVVANSSAVAVLLLLAGPVLPAAIAYSGARRQG